MLQIFLGIKLDVTKLLEPVAYPGGDKGDNHPLLAEHKYFISVGNLR